MRIYTPVWSAFLAFLLMTGTDTAQAQDNDQVENDATQDDSLLEEVIVTARGRKESLLEVPISETVFNAETIETARIRTVDDFIALTPGVTIANAQDAGTNFITIRGMSQTRNGEPPVAVVVDDVLQVNSRAFDQALFDLQSIEVLRGPQGALYGRNATNGAIIINTAAPADEFQGYVQGTYGDGDEYALEASVSGPVSEDIGYRVSFRYYDRDGYLDNVILDKKTDFLEEFNFRGHLSWAVSDRLTADLRASVTETDGGSLNYTYQPAVVDLNTGFPVAFDFSIADADLVQQDFVANNLGSDKRDVSQISLRLNYDMDWAVLRSVTAWDQLDQLAGADQFPYTYASSITPAPPFPFFDGTQTQHVDVDAFSQELRLTSMDDQRLRWMVGGYFLQTDRFISSTVGADLEQGILGVKRTPYLGDSSNPTTAWIADDNDNTAWALFFNLAYDVTDRLELAFAGRYDKDERKQAVDERQGAYDTAGNLLAPIGVPGVVNKADFSLFQPKLSIRYSVTDDFSIYGSWGKGFRSGQFNQNGLADIAAAVGIPGVKDVLDQEESETFELGAKAQFGGRFSLSAAIFNTEVTNAPYFVFIGGLGAQVLVGIDQVDITGGELELSASLNENWNAYMGVGVSDAEIKKYTLNPAAVGNEAPYVPESTFNLGLQYRGAITDSFGLFARVDYERRGEQFWDPENTTSRSALDLVRLRAGIESNDGIWSLIGSIDNATDEVYNSEWVLGGFAHAGFPRVWHIDLRYNF